MVKYNFGPPNFIFFGFSHHNYFFLALKSSTSPFLKAYAKLLGEQKSKESFIGLK